MKAYHGVTIAAASLTGLPDNHRDFDLPIAGHPAHELPASLSLRAGRRERGGVRDAARRRTRGADRQAKGPDTVAAFIAEPVMGAGGVIVPPKTYFEKIMAVCAKHDVLHDRRRGDLRLRPARHDVRLRDARLPAARRCRSPRR